MIWTRIGQRITRIPRMNHESIFEIVREIRVIRGCSLC
jgi:hypothetical protein